MTAPIYFANFAHTPMPRREGLGCWRWEITDGHTGPTLVSGTALTGRGALRARLHAEVRLRPESERPESERRQLRLDAVRERLEVEGLPVSVRIDEQDRVCVRPLCPCDTWDEVRVLRAFAAIAANVIWERAS